jgi:hypothetical protein
MPLSSSVILLRDLRENIGGGVTYRLGESGVKFYTGFRYHHASYRHVSTNIVPLTFGIRW